MSVRTVLRKYVCFFCFAERMCIVYYLNIQRNLILKLYVSISEWVFCVLLKWTMIHYKRCMYVCTMILQVHYRTRCNQFCGESCYDCRRDWALTDNKWIWIEGGIFPSLRWSLVELNSVIHFFFFYYYILFLLFYTVSRW